VSLKSDQKTRRGQNTEGNSERRARKVDVFSFFYPIEQFMISCEMNCSSNALSL